MDIKSAIKNIKNTIQSIIVLTAFIAIVSSLSGIGLSDFGGIFTSSLFEYKHPLKIASFALAIAAGFDLLYMLISQNIEEGVDALKLGFISAILMIVSEPNTVGWEIALTVFVFTVCLIAISLISSFQKKDTY